MDNITDVSVTSSQYEKKHPDYITSIRIYERNSDLYEGGEQFKRNVKRYLIKHPAESTNDFDIRIKRSAYANFAAPIVDTFASTIHKNVNRSVLFGDESTASEGIKNMESDCDCDGTSAATYFFQVSAKSAAIGAHFVCVDMPSAQGEALTLRDAKAKGIRPYFVQIPAQNMLNWSYGSDGELDFASFVSSEYVSAGPFDDYKTVRTVTVWYRDRWEKYQSTDSMAYEKNGEGPNYIGKVPVVPFIYEKHTKMTGKSVIDDVADIIIRVFNVDNEVDKTLFDSGIPVLTIFGMRKDDLTPVEIGSSSILTFSNENAHMSFVEMSGTTVAARRQQNQDDINAIREISLRQVRPYGAGVESAESKRMDSLQIESQLAAFARHCEAAEAKCWNLARAWLGEKGQDIKLEYNKVYDTEAINERIVSTIMEMRKNGDISRETAYESLKETGRLPQDFDPVSEQQKLMNEGKQVQGVNGSGAQQAAEALLGRQGTQPQQETQAA